MAAIPWYVWGSATALTATTAGLFWDLSWHLSIGRDTFWTPTHLAIHFGAIVAGISSAYLIRQTTFGKASERRASSLKVWGFYGPLGAFVSLWGGLTMLTSAPFDNWWHYAASVGGDCACVGISVGGCKSRNNLFLALASGALASAIGSG